MSDEKYNCVPNPPREILGRTKDLTGATFGHLVVLGFDCMKGYYRYWTCRCVCGVTKSIRGDHISGNRVDSCGCRGIEPLVAGKKIGWWTVLVEGERDCRGGRRWRCRCKCSRVFLVLGSALRCGRSGRCAGCRKVTHDMSNSDEYKIRSKMIWRCYNPKCRTYFQYGGRGIRVCERWLESFENFYEDMGPRPTDEHSIDRIDNNGNYCPENCRWATRKEQARNKRNNTFVVFEGARMCISEWAEKTGIGQYRISYLLRSGVTPEVIFSEHKVGTS